jgi:DNA-binding NarL/FixJ family response regulator
MRLVIAEDSVLLRRGLVRLLEDSGHSIAAEVGDGPALVAAIAEHRPDVSVVDVRMPPSHTDEGLWAAIEARTLVPEAPVLILSQYVEERYAGELMATGAAGVGYLLKDRVADVSDFLAALEQVAAGGTVLDPEVVSQLLVRRRSSPLEELTGREREVLGLMAQGRTNSAIASTLVITEGAVEKHVRNIFAKLGLPQTDVDHRRVLAVLAHLSARE